MEGTSGIYGESITEGITPDTASDIDESNWVGISGAVLISLTLTIGAGGNALVLLAIACNPKLRRSDNTFIASLAVNDLLFNVIIMPFYVDTYVNQRWRFDTELCKFETFLGTILVMSSAIHIGFIAMNRYFHVVHPTTIHLQASSRNGLCLQIASIWAICILTVLPGAIGWQADVGYSSQIGRCNYIRSTSKGSLTLIFLIGFILPSLMMFPFYILIMRKLGRSTCRLNTYKRNSFIPHHVGNKATERHACEVNGIHMRTHRGETMGKYDSTGQLTSDDSFESEEKLRLRQQVQEKRTCTGNSVYCCQEPDLVKVSFQDIEENCSEDAKAHKAPSLTIKQKSRLHPHNASGMRSIDATQTTELSLYPQETVLEASQEHGGCCGCAPQFVMFTSKLPQLRSVNGKPVGADDDESAARHSVLHHKNCHTYGHRKSIKMIMVIFLAFAFTYLPFTIINLVDGGSDLRREWYMISSLAFWTGACINPIIYGLMNRQFRKAYKMVCCPVKDRKERNRV